MMFPIDDPLDLTLEEKLETRLPIAGAAARQIARKHQVPYPLALTCVLAAMSTACKSLVDLRTPDGRRGPISLALLLLAKSGERKSTVFRRCMRALFAFENTLFQLYEEKLHDYHAELKKWKESSRELRAEYRKARRVGSDTSLLEAELTELEQMEPVPPVCFSLIYEDTSPKALLEGLDRTGIAALVSSEGGTILKGKAFESITQLSSAHSGETLTVHRSGKPALRILNPRLTMLIMVQPAVFDSLPPKKRDLARGEGLWARFLVFNPESTQGTRLSENACSSSDKIDAFDNRLVEICERLYKQLESNDRERGVIEFSSSAGDYLTAFANAVEKSIAPGGRYQCASDHASKLADNAARLAALFHYFEGFEGPVELDTVKVAIEICERSSCEFLSVFDCVPQHVSDAKLLWTWLCQKATHGDDSIEKNVARQGAPYRLREYGRFFEALEYLRQRRMVDLQKGTDGKMRIYFPGNAPPSANQLAVTGMPLLMNLFDMR